MRGVHNSELKQQAVLLRKKGYSYPMITAKLLVSKSTLNSWLSGLVLSKPAQGILLKRKQNNLVVNRKKASEVLAKKQDIRRNNIRFGIEKEFGSFDFNLQTKELLLAMLYLGEGFKKVRSCIGLGNSDPRITRMFVNLLRDLYSIKDERLVCCLHLRMDQDSEKEKIYWSKELQIPLSRFRKTQFDKRTAKTATWQKYHGVCSVYCYSADVHYRLMAMQELLIQKVNMGV